MPLYEYQCSDCGKAFEKVVHFSEADIAPTCPNCEGTDTNKIILTFAYLGIFESGSTFFPNAAVRAGGLPEQVKLTPDMSW